MILKEREREIQYEVVNEIQTLHYPQALGWGCITLSRHWNQKLHNEKIKMFVDDGEVKQQEQVDQYEKAKVKQLQRRGNEWWGFS